MKWKSAIMLVAGFVLASLLTPSLPCAQEPQPPAPAPGKAPFPRGAKPTPRHKIFATPKHRAAAAPPAQFAIVPKQLDVWGNNQYGDCVSAEEAFAKACYSPEIFIDPSVVISWARSHGFLNGADLSEVMDAMQKDGFKVGNQQYNDGPHQTVDYTNDTTLQSAISSGPVKIAIDANALPSGAGNHQGWYAFGRGRYPNTDHCVSLCGYGPASFCFPQLGAQVPSGVDANKTCYMLFTWSTIGIVDLPWLQGTCTEAWVRGPTTVGSPPLTPPVTNVPVVTSAKAAVGIVGSPFCYQITATNSPIAYGAANLPVGLTVNGVTGMITGTPAAAGMTMVSVAASNASGTGSSELVVTITGSQGPTPNPTPGPAPSNVSIMLTQDQVQSVITQSGSVRITKDTKLVELLDILRKVHADPMRTNKDKTP
jgi:hypothetical protein